MCTLPTAGGQVAASGALRELRRRRVCPLATRVITTSFASAEFWRHALTAPCAKAVAGQKWDRHFAVGLCGSQLSAGTCRLQHPAPSAGICAGPSDQRQPQPGQPKPGRPWGAGQPAAHECEPPGFCLILGAGNSASASAPSRPVRDLPHSGPAPPPVACHASAGRALWPSAIMACQPVPPAGNTPTAAPLPCRLPASAPCVARRTACTAAARGARPARPARARALCSGSLCA